MQIRSDSATRCGSARAEHRRARARRPGRPTASSSSRSSSQVSYRVRALVEPVGLDQPLERPARQRCTRRSSPAGAPSADAPRAREGRVEFRLEPSRAPPAASPAGRCRRARRRAGRSRTGRAGAARVRGGQQAARDGEVLACRPRHHLLGAGDTRRRDAGGERRLDRSAEGPERGLPRHWGAASPLGEAAGGAGRFGDSPGGGVSGSAASGSDCAAQASAERHQREADPVEVVVDVVVAGEAGPRVVRLVPAAVGTLGGEQPGDAADQRLAGASPAACSASSAQAVCEAVLGPRPIQCGSS